MIRLSELCTRCHEAEFIHTTTGVSGSCACEFSTEEEAYRAGVELGKKFIDAMNAENRAKGITTH